MISDTKPNKKSLIHDVTSSVSRDEKWISIKDKLPKDGDHIIFGANNVCDMQDRLCKPMVMAGWFMGGKFYSYLTKEVLKPNFWMSMPVLTNGALSCPKIR